jgi:hypothetical protein
MARTAALVVLFRLPLLAVARAAATSAPAEATATWASLAASGLSVLASWLKVVALLGLVAAVIWGLLKLMQRLIFFLGKDEQLVVVRLTDTEVHNGPGIHLVSPLVKSAQKRKGLLLEPLSYAKVKDVLTGVLRVETGPKLLFLGPYDEVVQSGEGQSLNRTEYCVVLDRVTGVKRVEKGPRVLVPGATEEVRCLPSPSSSSRPARQCKL